MISILRKCRFFVYLTIGLIIFFSFPQKIFAQQLNGVFMMSSMGAIQNMSNNGLTIVFNGSSNCLTIQNGSSVLIGERGSNSFATNCEVNTRFNALGLKIYPNPVSHSVKVSIAAVPTVNEEFSLFVYGYDGSVFATQKVMANELVNGKMIDLSNLPAGGYMIQVNSANTMDALKLVKIN